MKFFIVDKSLKPILGAKACIDLKILKIMINEINQNSNVNFDDLLKKNEDLFSGLGTMGSPYEITLKENVTPVVHPPRKVPFNMISKLKKTTD